MTNPKPAPTREGAIDTCPTWCETDHPDTNNYDKHSSEMVRIPALSSVTGEEAMLFVYANTFGPGTGVNVDVATMVKGGAWTFGGILTAEAAGRAALSLALFSTYTDAPAKAADVEEQPAREVDDGDPMNMLRSVLGYFGLEVPPGASIFDQPMWVDRMTAEKHHAVGLGLVDPDLNVLTDAGRKFLEDHGADFTVKRGRWYPEMPLPIPGETTSLYSGRLIRNDEKYGPYDHRRNRQCSIGYHDECSDPAGESCECPCHTPASA